MAQTLPWLQKCFGGLLVALAHPFLVKKQQQRTILAFLIQNSKMQHRKRLLANIEKWTYSTLYSIRWTLVSRYFTQINVREHADWPLPLAYFDIVHALTIRTKSFKCEWTRSFRTCSFAFVDVRNALAIFTSTHECLCSNVLQLYKEQKNIFIFTLRIN